MPRLPGAALTRTTSLALAVLLLCAARLPAADPSPPVPIILPDNPAPVPPPAPPPAPAPQTLAPGQFYVVRSAADFLLVASPDGMVKVTRSQGPMTFPGSALVPAQSTTTTYSEKYLAVVEAVGNGKVEILVSPAGTTDPAAVQRRCLLVGNVPPPTPPVPPTPADPFAAVLQVAYSQEAAPDKAAALSKLSEVYRQASVTQVNDTTIATVGALTAVLHGAAEALVGKSLPATGPVRMALAKELASKLPTDPNAPLDKATRDLIAAQFVRVFTLLGGLK